LTNGESLKAALLHDSVEDQPDVLIQLLGGNVSGGVNLQDEALRLIGERFGKRVSEMVAHLTNPDYREMALQAQMSGDPRGELELKSLLYKQHILDILERDPEAFLIKLADFSRNAFELSRLPEGDKLSSLRVKYAPVILALVEKLKEVPDQGHLLSPWRDDLRAKLLWVYARDYAS
jgi:(p)ppGpp synthase/HD superfamily hydrolase